MDPEDRIAWEKSCQGDLDAFSTIVRRHQGWLRAYLRARMADWSEADDLAQEAFLTAYRKIHQFTGEGELEPWLKTIAKNHLRNHVRKRRDECVGGSEELGRLLDQDAGTIAVSSGSLDALADCLRRIEGPSRALLNERYVEGKSVRDLAAESGRGYSALTMQLHRLREVLAECVRRKLELPEG
ncbi:sigma-70 family RNA polymerase sigma factor [Haloferula sp. BvORR071]|uniref:sigma-70 family RNA polymerase sigma factor n=1 Tax=Haloferula sp. BvORR071 TaxID=1396141 RepID=UPI0005559AF4|nr:sigma-70 family RNA polymerase sigma factor [Haloferula sp. BvORR071]